MSNKNPKHITINDNVVNGSVTRFRIKAILIRIIIINSIGDIVLQYFRAEGTAIRLVF